MGLAIRKHTCLVVSSSNSQSFETYLKSQNKRNIRQIASYARYHSILETADASPLISVQSGAMRRHAMESLTALSKYLGCYDRWQEKIRKRCQLRWTSGDESIKSLERFFNPALTLDNVYDRIGHMIAKTLPNPKHN
jgi:hypothetical protein